MFDASKYTGLLYKTNAMKFIEVFGYVQINDDWWDAIYLGDRNMLSKTNKEKFTEVFGIMKVSDMTDDWANLPYGMKRPELTNNSTEFSQYATVSFRIERYDAETNRYLLTTAEEGMVGGYHFWVKGEDIVGVSNGGHAVVIIGWGCKD